MDFYVAFSALLRLMDPIVAADQEQRKYSSKFHIVFY